MTLRSFASLLAVLASVAGAAGCGSDTKETQPPPVEVTPPPFGMPFDDLAAWHLFVDPVAQTPADGVIPYDVNSPLFTDYATKLRFVFVPKGKTATYADDDVWDFPVGTALVKTFAMHADLRDDTSDLRLLETRVEFKEPDGWSLNTYVWDEAQKTATRSVVGPIMDLTFVGEDGKTVHDPYTVPASAECKTCHQHDGPAAALGPRTRQMNRDHDYGGSIGSKNQIDELVALGVLSNAAPASKRGALVDPYGHDDVGERVRSYWDGNCGHCHGPGGMSSQSGLFLDYLSTDFAKDPDANWGICKSPTSQGKGGCGLTYDVVPGKPDESIMACRLASTDPQVRMPRLGAQLVNAEGLAVVRDWIASLPAKACAPIP